VPAAIGVDVAPDEIVPHIDRNVLEPWIGRVRTLLEIGAGGGGSPRFSCRGRSS
jgi:hypothetical protein